MNTIEGVVGTPRRHRRRHSPEFKGKVVQACKQAGVSMAAVALAHGLNANLLRRWVIEQDRTDAATNIQETMPLLAAGEFVPLQLTSPSNAASDIRVEVRRGATTVTVSWPAQESSACAAWLREWLK